jgi:nicotinamide phosphoribosyltransferase
VLNPLLAVDSYKSSHFLQYPPGTTRVSSYIESRGGPFKASRFFGLQGIIKKYLIDSFDEEGVNRANLLFNNHGLPFNDKWYELSRRRKHDGKFAFPIEIQAVPEGMDIPTGNVLMQVVNTDPEFAWLTSYVETLLMQVWYPTTVCTLSAEIRAILMERLEETCDDPKSVIPFLLHDFGCRGVSSMESAGIGGLGHLVNFRGTDTIPALVEGQEYYHEPMAGFSIPAMEHSTVTAWGRDGEARAFRNMLQRFGGPGKTLAMVVDSYDLFHAVRCIVGDELKDEIINSGSRVVVRPDSGDPRVIVPKILRILNDCFGGENNHKGYRVLHPAVRVIQGDGMDIESIRETGDAVCAAGFSTENVTYGLGGGLLQKVHRDTGKFAMKASAIEIDSIWYDVYKDPLTDPEKRSKRGRLALICYGQEWNDYKVKTGIETVRIEQMHDRENLLRPVYRDGELLIDDPLETIRRRAGTL